MNKASIFSLKGKMKEEVELPPVFQSPLRFDLIRRSFKVTQMWKKQPQGRDPLAGNRHSVESWGIGFGVARLPRQKGSGFANARNGAFVNMAKGGHRAHKPQADKNTKPKINKKEKKIALRSAIAASSRKELVSKRGHRIENVKDIPLIVDDKIQTVKKTQQIKEIFESLGLWDDVLKVKDSHKIRAGKGKVRGRRYKHKTGPLVVVKEDFGILKASRNLPGVDVVDIKQLSIENLAPGAMPGRLVLWTQSAFNTLSKL